VPIFFALELKVWYTFDVFSWKKCRCHFIMPPDWLRQQCTVTLPLILVWKSIFQSQIFLSFLYCWWQLRKKIHMSPTLTYPTFFHYFKMSWLFSGDPMVLSYTPQDCIVFLLCVHVFKLDRQKHNSVNCIFFLPYG